MGDQAEAPAASSTTVDMEAAEQLIQLSGGCDDAGGSGESESSIKAGEERIDDKEGVPAMESSNGEKEGDDKPAVVESSGAGKRPGAEKDRLQDDEAVMGGVTRRRPRFRLLVDIYRETKRIDHVHQEEAAEDKGRRRKGKGKKKKRATDGADDDEAIPAAAKRVVRRRSSTVRES